MRKSNLATPPLESRFVEVRGSRMHYVESGTGAPIVLLHGNPSSSFLWRNVIPYLSGLGRCIAPDLIGFGRSDKPRIPYRIFDQAEYIAAFIQALGLEDLTLVLHDCGGFVGLSYAADHPGEVRGIVLLEALVKPMRMADRPEPFQRTFRLLRSAAGRDRVLGENLFVERVLPTGLQRDLTSAEMDAYRAPFPTPESREPIWVLASEMPIDGHPSDVHSALWASTDKVAKARIPILMLTFEPGAMIGPAEEAWARETFPVLTVQHMGAGIHFVQEDNPQAIGCAITQWLAGLPARD